MCGGHVVFVIATWLPVVPRHVGWSWLRYPFGKVHEVTSLFFEMTASRGWDHDLILASVRVGLLLGSRLHLHPRCWSRSQEHPRSGHHLLLPTFLLAGARGAIPALPRVLFFELHMPLLAAGEVIAPVHRMLKDGRSSR